MTAEWQDGLVSSTLLDPDSRVAIAQVTAVRTEFYAFALDDRPTGHLAFVAVEPTLAQAKLAAEARLDLDFDQTKWRKET